MFWVDRGPLPPGRTVRRAGRSWRRPSEANKFSVRPSAFGRLWTSLQYKRLLEHLEHMGREEHGRTWCMDAAQLDTQRKKEEVILTGRVPQLDRPSFNSIELRSQQSNPKNVASPLTFL
ncbi:unnamed protein product [Microthlaspi erraticum]|uniref:Uncharacterized protein n=1 Tax=Microthlaspi erraticum TaxID=1685480 RepID=A0A6D2LPZ2_9BRAS|nr:unnamed protein product [Microthlaspi erraticum]